MDSTVTTMATSPSERLFQSSSSSGDESNETRSMAIRSGMSHSEWNQTFEELKTIQFHIESNRQHIEQLNNRFSGQNPSQFYIMEYEDLTEKLHNLSFIAITVISMLVPGTVFSGNYGSRTSWLQ